MRNLVGVPLHASCTRAVRSFRAAALRCGRAGVDRRAAHSWVCDPQPAWTDSAVGGPGEVGGRRATVRSVAALTAAGHAATDRGARLQVTLRLDVDDRSAEVSIVVTSHGTWIVVVVEVDRQWSNVEVPTACVDCGNRMREPRHIGAPTAADRSPQVPRRHAAGHNQRGWRHRHRYDQIQPPTAASNGQIPCMQETSVQPRNHGPGLRITRAYRGNTAGVGVG